MQTICLNSVKISVEISLEMLTCLKFCTGLKQIFTQKRPSVDVNWGNSHTGLNSHFAWRVYTILVKIVSWFSSHTVGTRCCPSVVWCVGVSLRLIEVVSWLLSTPSGPTCRPRNVSSFVQGLVDSTQRDRSCCHRLTVMRISWLLANTIQYVRLKQFVLAAQN